MRLRVGSTKPFAGLFAGAVRRIPLSRLAVLIYVLAAAVRLTLVFGYHHCEYGRPEPIRVALSLARSGSFANPYAIPTGPTAHVAPVHPLLLAPIYAIWGDTRTADRVRTGATILEASAQYALLPCVSAALGLGAGSGVIGGLLGAVIPLHYLPETQGVFEVTTVALFLELSTIFFARFLAAPSLTVLWALRAGVWWGLGFLLSPNLVAVLAGFILIGLWKRRLTGPVVRWLAILAATIFLVIAPWLVRNRALLGAWFFVRDNFGLELFVSNRDGATPDVMLNRLTWRHVHPHQSPEVAREVVRMGEVAFERERLHEAEQWISTHPHQFLNLTLGRLRGYWFPLEAWHRRVVSIFTAVSLVALLTVAFRSRPAATILVVIVGTYSAVYTIIEVSQRYMHPIWWVLLLASGFAGKVLLEKTRAFRARAV